MSSPAADRPAHLAHAALYQGANWRIQLIGRRAHLADAALYQGAATAQQHSPIHRRPVRTTDAQGVARETGKVHQ